ncbi:MAG TPA: prolyl oligopeptidase family serine peptidase [Polyangiaceae bacterium]
MGKGSREEKFGVVVEDPWRWLEEESAETRAWQDAQNRATDDYLARLPDLPALRARVAALLETGFCETPFIAGKRAFYMRREGAAQQPKLMVRESDGRERVLLDAETLSPDATDAIDWWYPSPGGTRVAWGKSSEGSEQSVLFVRDVETGLDLECRIEETQHCVVAWTSESSFFYTRHHGGPYDARLYFHEIGRDSKDDPLIFGEGRDKTDLPQPIVSPCGRWLVVVVQQGWSKNELYLRDLRDPHRRALAPIATGEEALFEPIARRDALYVMTNSGAPRYRLFAVPWESPSRASWREILPETSDVLTGVAVTKNRIVASYLRDASSVLVEKGGREIALPSIGSASVSSSPDDDDVYVGFTSFVVPLGAWKLRGDALEPWARVARAPDASQISVERRFAESRDGTRVPLFVVRKRESELPAPAILYGYGGFNVNQTPAFSSRALAFVERGGVFASAVLRGGGEYGEAWHRAGMLENKQNVFDDYFACAEELVASGLTTTSRLAALGGSNGGLLVNAAVVQRPELFAAGVSLVPLADMLRYHLFRLGAFWLPEYGSPDEEAAFRVLYNYSPLHRAKPAVYPAMLLWTAESDSRVDPMHARKMAATLAALTTSGNPVLLRVETKAGHGMGKPTAKVADQVAAELAFILAHTGKKAAAGA